MYAKAGEHATRICREASWTSDLLFLRRITTKMSRGRTRAKVIAKIADMRAMGREGLGDATAVLLKPRVRARLLIASSIFALRQ